MRISAVYDDAAAHYLSPDRRDPVKRYWEEPVNHRILASAIESLPRASRPLRVLDVGAGTGDGLALLEGGLARTSTPTRPVHYVGLDPDPAMIATAREAHAHRDDVEFVQGDVRDELPVDDVDLYLSAGVPYSHLPHEDLPDALGRVLADAARRDEPSAVVIDVLGRYSIEWTTRWDQESWDYRMSFFQGADGRDGITAPMSVHSRGSVQRALTSAARRTGAGLRSVTYHDRSVVVGRHTTTGAFSPGLPAYRSMVNRLYEGDVELPLADLRLTPPAVAAPAEVAHFFTGLAAAWNGRLDRAAAGEEAVGPTAAGRTRLAEHLCALEHDLERGLGAAHTLIGVALIDPAQEAC